MVYKLISAKQIVAKVYSDLDLGEEAQRNSDFIEWVGEALEKIGSVRQLTRKISGEDGSDLLQIKGHQVSLPSDLFRLNSVSYSATINGPWFPMKLATGSFDCWSDDGSIVYDDNGRIVPDAELIEMTKILYNKYVEDPIYTWFNKMDYQTALEILNTNQNVRTLLTNLVNKHNHGTEGYLMQYSIKPGFISTSPRMGYVRLSYDAIPLDTDGYPMVPDMISYIEAIYWYIVMKLKYPEYLSGKMQRQIYYDIRNSWNFYCKQAYGESLMPNQDEMENIKDEWNKLMPEMNSNIDFYSSVGKRQNIKNFNR